MYMLHDNTSLISYKFLLTSFTDSFINITLLQSEYTFGEDEDLPTVCVDLVGNTVLGMVVDIELRTINGTAVGGPPGICILHLWIDGMR